MSRRNKMIIANNTEDSYLKNYNKHLGRREKSKKAYVIKGKKLPLFATGVIHGYVNLPKLKEICKEKEITITRIFDSCFNKNAIYQENYKKYNGKKPIKVCIPVNLKKYFKSTTISNFFSYITLETNFKNEEFEDFENIIEFVKNVLRVN